MNKVLYAIYTVLAFTSCASSYNIQGSSNVQDLNGQKLYLKVAQDAGMRSLDSCDVVHGQFSFAGDIDSVYVASIYMDEMNVMPVVLESGDITIRIDNAQHLIGGTPLNDRLYQFLKSFIQLQSETMDIDHEQSQALMQGISEQEANMQLLEKAMGLYQQEDKLFTTFVTENFDNILGPWGFLYRVNYDINPMNYPYSIGELLYANATDKLPVWIEYIMNKATDKFKNDADVRAFYEDFQRNQRILNGTEEQPRSLPAPAPGTTKDAAIAPPTPKEMAGDTARSDED